MIFGRRVRLLLDAERRVAQIGVGSPLLPSDKRLLRRLEDLIAHGDREASDLFGQLLLARCQAAEEDAGQDELLEAAIMLQPLYRADPSLAPEELRWFCAAPHRALARPVTLWNEGHHVLEPYWATGDVDSLRAGIPFFDRVAELLRDDEEQKIMAVETAGRLHKDLFDLTGESKSLDRYVSLLRKALSLLGEDASERRLVFQGALAAALRTTFLADGPMGLIDEAEDLLRSVLTEIPEDHPLRPVILNNLSAVLGVRYDRTAAPGLLSEAAELLRRAVAMRGPADTEAELRDLISLEAVLSRLKPGTEEGLREWSALIQTVLTRIQPAHTPGEDDRTGNLLNDLYNVSSQLFQLSRDREFLVTAIEAAERVLADTRRGQEDRPIWLNNLGVRKLMLSMEEPELRAELIVEAQAILRASLAAEENALPGAAIALGVAAAVSFTADFDPRHLAELDLMRARAISSTAPGSPERAGHLFNLVKGLKTAHNRSGADELHAQIVITLRELEGVMGPAHPEYYLYRWITGWSVLIGFKPGDPVERLTTCAAGLQDTLDQEPQERKQLLHILGTLRKEIFRQTGELSELTQATVLLRRAVAITGAGDDDRADILETAADALCVHYEAAGAWDDLLEAERFAREAVEGSGEAQEFHRLQWMLSHVLCVKFGGTADPETLAECLAVARASTQGAGNPLVRRAAQSNLCYVLYSAYGHYGDPAMLEEAMRAGRAAIEEFRRTEAPSEAFNNLGAIFAASFSISGRLDLLDEAIDCLTRALERSTPEHADRSFYLMNLGRAMIDHYEYTEEASYLRQAIDFLSEAVPASRRADPMWSGRMVTLSQANYLIFGRTRDRAALDAAVQNAEAAVAGLRPGYPDAAACHNALGVMLKAIAEWTKDVAALSKAIEVFRHALDLQSQTLQSAILHNLSSALLLHVRLTGETSVLVEAESTARRVHEISRLNREQVEFDQITLGEILCQVHETTGRAGAFTEALDLFAEVFDDVEAKIMLRVDAGKARAQAWARAGESEAALDAYASVVDLVSRLAPISLGRDDRAHRLGWITGLGSEAAAVALAADGPGRAVEFLERTRGVLLAEQIGTRGDLSALRDSVPGLAAEYDRISSEMWALDIGEQDGLLPETGGAIPERARIQRRTDVRRRRAELAAQWDGLIEEIRGLPGHGRFLRPATIADLCGQAGKEPVVLITRFKDEGHALLVDEKGVRPVQLPDMDEESFVKHANHVRRAVKATDWRTWIATWADLERALEWLWDAVCEPVLDALEIGSAALGTPAEELPRVWWCPTGELAYFPFHAAGRHVGPDASGSNVLDRAVSSYTPTIRALGYARGSAPAHPDPRTLVVAMPETPGERPLPAVNREAEGIAALVPGCLRLTGSKATRKAVLTALGDHPVVHFACHGVGDGGTSIARLVLSDHQAEPLTVKVLAGLRLNAELAYLSACSTTESPAWRIDEALHITGGFQLAGFRRVVGTLWPIPDESGADLALAFYDRLTGGGTTAPDPTRSALALHEAIVQVRSRDPRGYRSWAGHIHVGPLHRRQDVCCLLSAQYLINERAFINGKVAQKETPRTPAPHRNDFVVVAADPAVTVSGGDCRGLLRSAGSRPVSYGFEYVRSQDLARKGRYRRRAWKI